MGLENDASSNNIGSHRQMQGSIKLNGTEITDKPTFERARAGVAYVPREE